MTGLPSTKKPHLEVDEMERSFRQALQGARGAWNTNSEGYDMYLVHGGYLMAFRVNMGYPAAMVRMNSTIVTTRREVL